jgi:Amt family ammonium transporter
LLTPVFALVAIAPVSATVWTNGMGAIAVLVYAGAMTWVILKVISVVMKLRVGAAQENVGLDISEHGEMLAPSASASQA